MKITRITNIKNQIAPTLPSSGLGEAKFFGPDSFFRINLAYDSKGVSTVNDEIRIFIDAFNNNYRAEFTENPWRSPGHAKNPSYPYGTEHIIKYKIRFANDYLPHPADVIISQGHTAGSGKLPVWTFGMCEGGTMRSYGNIKKEAAQGELCVNLHAFGDLSSKGTLMANRYPLGITPKAGDKFEIVIRRVAALKEDGGRLTIWKDGVNIFDLNCDMVYPDEKLCDNWKVGCYHPALKTANQSTQSDTYHNLRNLFTKTNLNGYKKAEFFIKDIDVIRVLPGESLPQWLKIVMESASNLNWDEIMSSIAGTNTIIQCDPDELKKQYDQGYLAGRLEAETLYEIKFKEGFNEAHRRVVDTLETVIKNLKP